MLHWVIIISHKIILTLEAFCPPANHNKSSLCEGLTFQIFPFHDWFSHAIIFFYNLCRRNWGVWVYFIFWIFLNNRLMGFLYYFFILFIQDFVFEIRRTKFILHFFLFWYGNFDLFTRESFQLFVFWENLFCEGKTICVVRNRKNQQFSVWTDFCFVIFGIDPVGNCDPELWCLRSIRCVKRFWYFRGQVF